ncbi:MAG TPA: hypothetical protein DCL15_13585 [Chloroflexi bacterium]|nr:hypothetical protein [Chloroflexota bacterium]HHW87401.1 hypothetical protein [Chloroflexota bacterium]
MKQWWDEWVKEPFLRILVEVSWFGPVLTAILVALLVNMLTEALTSWGGVGFGFLVWAVLAACTVTFVYLYELARRRRRREGTALGMPADREHPKQSKGLVFLYTNDAALREAIEYHRPVLKHCWLVVTPELQTAAANVIGQMEEIHFAVKPISDLYNTRACYDTANHIFEREAPLQQIPLSQVMADITGGTKPMTVGLLLACVKHGVAVEHVPALYDKITHKPIGTLPPIAIELS